MNLNTFVKEYLWVGNKSKKVWVLLVYIVLWVMMLIYNSHRYEKKVFQMKALTEEVKELSSEFVDVRSELMRKRMESHLIKKMKPVGIAPSNVPPTKIDVIEGQQKKWYELW